MGFYRFSFSCLLNFILIIFSIRKIFITSVLCLFSSFIFAATDEQLLAQADARYKQYLAQQQAAREAYAKSQSVAKAAAAAQAVVDNGVVTSNAAMDTVVQGSSMSSKSTVAKAADAAKAAGTIASRYGKAALRGAPGSFLGYAAFEGLMKGIGWLQDEGSKVPTKPNPSDTCLSDGSNCASFKNIFGNSQVGYFSSLVSFCKAYVPNKFNYSSAVHPSNSAAYICYYYNTQADAVANTNKIGLTVWPVSNPSYSPSAPVPSSPATQQEIQDAIQKYLTEHPNSEITNNIYNASYNYDKTFELSDDQTNLLARQIGQAVIDGLNAAAPSGSSTVSNNDSSGTPQKTTTTIDSTGTTTGSTSTTTTTNPDGTSTTSTTTATSDLPAFCSWASVVCDWINWTKQEPQQEQNTKPVLKELDITEETQNRFNWAKQCPAPVSEDVEILGQSWTYEFSYEPICTAFDKASWFFVFASLIGAVFIVAGVRNG